MKKLILFVILVVVIGYCRQWTLENDKLLFEETYSGIVDKSFKHSFILKMEDDCRYEVQHTTYLFPSSNGWGATVGAEVTIIREMYQSGFTKDIYYTYKVTSYKGKTFESTNNGSIYKITKL